MSARPCSGPSRMAIAAARFSSMTGVVQQHQGEQSDRLGLGKQVDEQSPQPDRFASETRAGEVALIEDEIDDVQYAGESFGEIAARRDFVGNARVADLRLRPHDALR